MSKFSVGDKVKIREDLEVNKYCGGQWVSTVMKKHFGKKSKIVDINYIAGNPCYIIKDAGEWVWTSEMIECLEQEKEGEDKMSKFEVGDRVISVGRYDKHLARVEFVGKPDVRGVKYLVSYKNRNDTIVYRKARDCDLMTVEIEEGDTVELDRGKGKVEYIFNKKEKYDNTIRCLIDLTPCNEYGNYYIRHLKNLKLVEKGDKDV